MIVVVTKPGGLAVDDALMARIRNLLMRADGVAERRMFGGVVFLFDGNIGVGVHAKEMIVRTTPEIATQALRNPQVRAFDLSGKILKGWLLVAAKGTARDIELRKWLSMGSSFARSLPAK